MENIPRLSGYMGSAWAQGKLYLNEFPPGDVKLLDGEFKAAMDLNTTHLLKYSVDLSGRKVADIAAFDGNRKC